MKIKKEHYTYLQECFEKKLNDTAHSDELMYWLALTDDTRIKDINKRARWDLFNYSVPGSFTCDVLYTYMNDDHIDTAIKKIATGLQWIQSTYIK